MILAIVVLSVFAFYGIFLMVMELLNKRPGKSYDAGFRIILAVPEGAADSLEGVIRRVFSEEMPEKLMTDGKLYISGTVGNRQAAWIIRDLQRMYPIELLPHPDKYCIITGRGSKKSDA